MGGRKNHFFLSTQGWWNNHLQINFIQINVLNCHQKYYSCENADDFDDLLSEVWGLNWFKRKCAQGIKDELIFETSDGVYFRRRRKDIAWHSWEKFTDEKEHFEKNPVGKKIKAMYDYVPELDEIHGVAQEKHGVLFTRNSIVKNGKRRGQMLVDLKGILLIFIRELGNF